MPGIYVHIPFCRSRCIYCGFYSTTLHSLRQSYVAALCREAEARRDYTHGPFGTIYIGGGTPSTLGCGELDTLFAHIYKVYDIEDGAEVTMECNPDDVTPDFAAHIARTPVNRVSLGVQTFSDKRLGQIRRRHNAEQARQAVKLLRKAGISNISIDLMFGFPGETIADWTYDISEALRLHPEHISAYGLSYEDGTPLKEMLERGEVEEISDELGIGMYDELTDRLCGAGYEHYEISNFALTGRRSRHNSGYWRQEPYIGLGAAAHSFDLKSRQWNVADIGAYIRAMDNGENCAEREQITPDTTFNDIITTALRTREGISLGYIERHLGRKYREALLENAARHVKDGLLDVSGDTVRLTRKGIYISNMVMSDLMIV